jgi:hypothetical protein
MQRLRYWQGPHRNAVADVINRGKVEDKRNTGGGGSSNAAMRSLTRPPGVVLIQLAGIILVTCEKAESGSPPLHDTYQLRYRVWQLSKSPPNY